MKIEGFIKNLKRSLIIGIILILVSIFFYWMAISISDDDVNATPVDWGELKKSGNDAEETYVKVMNIWEPDQFAELEGSGNDYKYYIVGDENNVYIAKLTVDTFNKIESAIDEQGENFSYELKGYIYAIPDEVKKLAIDRVREYSEEDFTDADFDQYFGKYYLDEIQLPNDGTVSLCVCLGVFSDIFAFACLITYFIKKSKVKKTLKEFNKDELEKALENSVAYEKAKIYLADEYLISTASGLDIIKYDDLYWIYINKTKYRGITTGRYLIAIKKDKRSVQIAYAVRDEKMLQEIMEKIHEKNDQILIGYTPENQKAFAEFRKNK